MKNTLIIFFLFITQLCFSQQYFDNTSTWQIYKEDLGGINNYFYFSNLTFDGDTVINAIEYLKVNQNGYEMKIGVLFGFDTTYTDIDQYYGAVRQEGKKIFGVKTWASEEELLYDFDWQLGDTISTGNHIVDSIATIEFAGEIRKQFFVSGSCPSNFEITR